MSIALMCDRTKCNEKMTSFGNTASLSSCSLNIEGLETLTQQVREVLNDTTVLYTDDIVEGYRRRVMATNDSATPHMKSQESSSNNRRPNDKKRRKVELPVTPTIPEYIQVLTSDVRYTWLPDRAKMTIFLASNILFSVQRAVPIGMFRLHVNALFNRSDKALVAPGEVVGVIAAQSVSEQFTQSSLDSHATGGSSGSATTGFKRIMEILDATKKLRIPTMGPITGNVEKLFETTLYNLCIEHGVVHRPDLVTKGCSPHFIFIKLKDGSSNWKTIIKSPHLPSTIKKRMALFDDTVYIRFPLSSPEHEIRMSMDDVLGKVVYGIPGCVRYAASEELLIFRAKTPLTRDRANMPVPVSIIDPCMLMDVCPDVNLLKLTSNDIYYIQSTLGIAAAETFIFRELKKTLADEGINVNVRHLNLIVANMCVGGSIAPNKFGGVDIEDSVLLKATFQEGTTTFAKAAAGGLTDNLNGVSSQILMGDKPNLGTAMVSIQQVSYEPTYGSGHEYGGGHEYGSGHDGPTPSSPEYAPVSPMYVDWDPDMTTYKPSSPVYMTMSPAEEIIEPEMNHI